MEDRLDVQGEEYYIEFMYLYMFLTTLSTVRVM
jgi:hypothetical protein